MVGLLLSLTLSSSAAEPAVHLDVHTPAFARGATIPVAFTCSGANRSPELSWTAGPPSTHSYAVVVDDPDAPAGTWVHWTVWNLPATATSLPAGVEPGAPGMVQGLTSFGKAGWGGPCPPKGHGAHRYFFRVYALDVVLPLTAAATRVELDRAMQGHVVADGEVMGKFWRD